MAAAPGNGQLQQGFRVIRITSPYSGPFPMKFYATHHKCLLVIGHRSQDGPDAESGSQGFNFCRLHHTQLRRLVPATSPADSSNPEYDLQVLAACKLVSSEMIIFRVIRS